MEVAVAAGIHAASDPRGAAKRAGQRAMERLRDDQDGAAPVADTAWADAMARDFPDAVRRGAEPVH